MNLQSLSTLDRVDACPPSAILQSFDGASDLADEGSSLHEHLHMRSALGVDAAMERLPKVLARWNITGDRARIVTWRARSFTWSPPRGSVAELALALLKDGSVVRVKGGRGKYETPEGAITAGTLDLIWSEPEPLIIKSHDEVRVPYGSTLWATDYKSGDNAYVAPIDHNAQIGTGAMLAAKWTKADHVVPALIFIEPGQGEWETPGYVWGAQEIADAETRARLIISRVDAERKHIEAGGVPRVKEGKWCQFCPARDVCPAKVAMIRAALGDPAPMVPRPLTLEQKRLLASRVGQVGQLYGRMQELLKDIVATDGPIDMGGGFEYGPDESERDKITFTEQAHRILLDEVGDHLAEAVKVTKSGIERAVSMAHLEAGIVRQKSAAMRRITEELRKVGAMRKEPWVEYRVHRRLPVLPSATAATNQIPIPMDEGDAP